MSVEEQIEQLKACMPKTYKLIQEAANTRPATYRQVRRGLQGDAGCFYARERVRKPGQLEQWFVAGTRAGFETVTPEHHDSKFNDFVEVVFCLPVQAPAHHQG